MKQCRLNQVFAGTVAALAAMAACAPSAAAAEETAVSRAVTVTANRVEQELADVPMSVSVVTQEEIERSSARNVAELLQDVAGITVTASGSPSIKRVSIRGEDATRTLVLIDGQKISEQKTMDGAPLLIDTSVIERVEVIRGPASVQYGSDALGGVVNIITKKGGNRPVQGSVTAGLDTGSSTKNAAASIYGAASGWTYRLSAAITDAEEVDTPKGKMEDTYFTQKSASAFASYNFTDNVLAGVSVDHFDLDTHVKSYNSTQVNDIPAWKRTKGAVFAEAKNLTEYLARVRADAYVQTVDKDMTVLSSRTTVYDNDGKTYGFSLQADWQLGDRNYLVTGYEFLYDDLKANTLGITSRGVTMYDVGYDGYQMNNAIFAAMTTELPHHFTLNYGLRHTWIKNEMDSDYKAGTSYYPNGKKTSGSHSSDKTVFNLGVVWTGIENLTLRAGYSQGYRSPNLLELYVGLPSGMLTADPTLKPEKSDNFEAGARWNSRDLTIDAAAFYNKVDNYIETFQTGPMSYVYKNVAKATVKGVEFTGSYRVPGTGFEPYATLTYTHRKYDDGLGSTTTRTGKAEFMARYGMRWAGEYDGMKLHSDVYARSRTRAKFSNPANDLGGFTTFNITGGVNFGKDSQYGVDVGLYNLFDKGYREYSSLYEPGRYFAVKLNAKF